MPDWFRVDPSKLEEAAGKLRTVASDLKSTHGDVHSKIESLVAEFGESATASALRDRLSDMEAESDAHHRELLGHRGRYISAGKEYLDLEERNRKNIEGV